MPGDDDLEPSQLVKRMCLEPIDVLMLLDSERKKAKGESTMMSRAINGLACNDSKTKVYFARTDAASLLVLFLFDLDFPTMITEKIRNVWADVMNAAKQWWTRLQDAERNDSKVNPCDQCEVNRKQCDNQHPKWMKNDFPVFLTRKCEQHGAITTTNDEMFGCSGMVGGIDVTAVSYTHLTLPTICSV